MFIGNYIFGDSGSVSRLFKEFRDERGLFYSVGSFANFLRDTSIFGISFSVDNERIGEALELSRSMLRDFVENGPTEEELDL